MDAKTALKIIIILSLAGMAVDSLLTYNKIYSEKIGCPIGGGCDIVASSPYSVFLGIPVSVLGLGAYLFLFAVAILGLNGKISEKNCLQLIIAFSAAGMIIALWFIYLMEFVIQAICPWCLLSHAILFGILTIALYAFLKLLKK